MMTPGFVYIIKDITLTQCYKIGHTANPNRRVYDFGIALPFEIMVVMLIKVNDPLDLETTLHHTFAHKRTNDEWFKLTDVELTYAKYMVEMRVMYSKYLPEDRIKIWNYLESKRLEMETKS